MFKIVLKMLFAITVLLTVAVPASAQSKAERPEVKVADSWEYSFRDTRYAKPGCNYSLTIKEVTIDKITGSLANPQSCDVSIWGASPVFNKDFNFLFPDGTPYPAFAFPLEVGKTWYQEFEFSIGNRNWTNKLTGKVVAVEKITVPAGTFDAFKIVLERKYRGKNVNGHGWAGTIEETLWYSPVVKNNVKRTFSDSGTSPSPVERELLKYSVQ